MTISKDERQKNQCFPAGRRCLKRKGLGGIEDIHKSIKVLNMLDVKASYDSKETVKMQLMGGVKSGEKDKLSHNAQKISLWGGNCKRC